MKFYVYTHARPDGSVFYVGKGKKRRAWSMSAGRNRHHKSIIKKHGKENIIVTIHDAESEEDAFAMETAMIKELRATGITLCNKTSGGEGASGRPLSEKTRLAFAEANANRVCTEEQREAISARLRGRVKSATERANIAARQRGKKRPQSVIDALIAANTGRVQAPDHRAKSIATLAAGRDAATEWHASEEGIAWHSEHAKKTWDTRPFGTVDCKHCGRPFNTQWPTRAKFCHLNCRQADLRARRGENVGSRPGRKVVHELTGVRAAT